MDKNIIIYIILVALSLCVFFIIIGYKTKLVRSKQDELNERKRINKCLVGLFYEILQNK